MDHEFSKEQIHKQRSSNNFILGLVLLDSSKFLMHTGGMIMVQKSIYSPTDPCA